MPTPVECAWAAGLFEGEGSIYITARRQRDCQQAGLKLAMTDEDTVRRFADVFGFGNVSYYQPANRKLVWCWSVSRFEHVQAVIAMCWFGLGQRRRARAAEILVEARRQYIRKRGPNGRFVKIKEEARE